MERTLSVVMQEWVDRFEKAAADMTALRKMFTQATELEDELERFNFRPRPDFARPVSSLPPRLIRRATDQRPELRRVVRPCRREPFN